MKAITRFFWIVAATVVCVLPMTAQNPAGDVAPESDFDFAVRQIEACYAGYPSLVTDANGVTLWIPISRSCGLPEQAINGTEIEPDVRITLPLPASLTDNVDEWVLFVAEDIKN